MILRGARRAKVEKEADAVRCPAVRGVLRVRARADSWPAVCEAATRRPRLEGDAALLARTWQALSAEGPPDPTLAGDLDAARAAGVIVGGFDLAIRVRVADEGLPLGRNGEFCP
jgi:hypothetical protein